MVDQASKDPSQASITRRRIEIIAASSERAIAVNVELGQSKIHFASQTVGNDIIQGFLLNEPQIISVSTPILVVLLVTISMDQLKIWICQPEEIRVEVIDNQLAPTLIVITCVRIIQPPEILVGTSGRDGGNNVGLKTLSEISIDVFQRTLDGIGSKLQTI